MTNLSPTDPDKNDLILWDEIRNGNLQSFSKVYEKYMPVLFNYGTKLTKDENIVEDNIHDLFVDIWQSKQALNISGSLKYYLLISYRRRVLKAIVKQRKDQNHEDHQFEFLAENIEDKFIAQSYQSELKQKLKAALQSLTKRQREAIYLKFFQSMDYDEIAEVMEISVEAVYVLMSKAIKALKVKTSLILLLISAYFIITKNL